jgi:flagellar biosynthesis/type III secretory pathway chaperone
VSDTLSPPTDLAESLTVEVAGYNGLLELLCAEQEALRVADADALARVSRAKQTQVHALQDLGAARTRLLREGAFGDNAAGMRALLARSARPDRARAQWDTLVGLAAHALRQNALNSRLASVQRQHVDRAMAALWSAAGCVTTYGADGRSQHHASSRSLAAI